MPPKGYNPLKQSDWMVTINLPQFAQKEPYDPQGEMVAITLDDMFEFLAQTPVDSWAFVCFCRVIVKNPNFNPPAATNGKLNIKPITTARLSNMSRETLEDVKRESLLKNSMYIVTEGIPLDVNRETGNFYNKKNIDFMRRIFEQYNGEVYGMKMV